MPHIIPAFSSDPITGMPAISTAMTNGEAATELEPSRFVSFDGTKIVMKMTLVRYMKFTRAGTSFVAWAIEKRGLSASPPMIPMKT